MQWASAQSPTPNLIPEPPHDIPLVEKTWDQLSNKEVGTYGQVALGIKPEKWKHAETENFIIHYKRFAEARPAAREVEYDLWFVAKTLQATKAEYTKKSHVFIFEDEAEWHFFIGKLDIPSWSQSFAHGDELFLNIRQKNGILNSHTLAHETTHAVVARIYPHRNTTPWPIWLNEGFAEYMGSACVANRGHMPVAWKEQDLENADIPLAVLTKTNQYPSNPIAVGAFYQSSEKLVRLLMTKSPKDRFIKFIDVILTGAPLQDAILQIYGDQYKNFDAFDKKYQTFNK